MLGIDILYRIAVHSIDPLFPYLCLFSHIIIMSARASV